MKAGQTNREFKVGERYEIKDGDMHLGNYFFEGFDWTGRWKFTNVNGGNSIFIDPSALEHYKIKRVEPK